MRHSKRKLTASVGLSRKKAKKEYRSTDELPWTKVSRPKEAGVGGDDGILDLEEVDNVQVVYEETPSGRLVKFKVMSSSQDQDQDDPDPGSEPASRELPGPARIEPAASSVLLEPQALLPAWHSMTLNPLLLQSLHKKSFTTPTPIQESTIPLALAGRDVIGVAQTGSGKTLAYGLPILHSLLSDTQDTIKPNSGLQRTLRALILAPTRELAFQVTAHLRECLDVLHEPEHSESSNSSAKNVKGKNKRPDSVSSAPRPPPPVSVAAIVGGMSAQKQRRILNRGVDILVATPGRLWDIMEEDDALCARIRALQFLVLDEADRMIEAGHFAELDNILRLTLRPSSGVEQQFDDDEKVAALSSDKDEDGRQANTGANLTMQTFIFSATLSKELQRNLRHRGRPHHKQKKDDKPASTLDELLLRLDFRDPEPAIVDIAPSDGVVSTLRECKIECLTTDKDVYLYYFLLRYPGRSLVFLSSIDGIRRLMPLMDLLDVKAFPLHSQLEQRQRLKNLDRFKANAFSVLLATDIAARGLDIPSVDHVIHYQIPRSADAYVHRKGRTARAMRKGFSMLMCAPDERKLVKGILGSLGREEGDIPEMSVDLDILDKLKSRVQLARQIDSAQHKVKKEQHDRNWVKETAAAMELEVDSDFASDDTAGDGRHGLTWRKKRRQEINVASLKGELKRMLRQPLLAKGVSAKYITWGVRPAAEDLIRDDSHHVLLGVMKVAAENSILV